MAGVINLVFHLKEIISDLSGLNMDADFNKKPPEPPPDYDKLNASGMFEKFVGIEW